MLQCAVNEHTVAALHRNMVAPAAAIAGPAAAAAAEARDLNAATGKRAAGNKPCRTAGMPFPKSL